MGIFKHFKIIYFLFLLCSIVLLTMGNAGAEDNATFERLEKIIQQQQLRIDAQAEAIEALQKQVKAMQADTVKTAEDGKNKKFIELVNSGNDKAKVTLYGQINRGVLFLH